MQDKPWSKTCGWMDILYQNIEKVSRVSGFNLFINEIRAYSTRTITTEDEEEWVQ